MSASIAVRELQALVARAETRRNEARAELALVFPGTRTAAVIAARVEKHSVRLRAFQDALAFVRRAERLEAKE